MEYEPDADMIFNYLMVSALAAATDFVEREGLRPTGGNSSRARLNFILSHYILIAVLSKKHTCHAKHQKMKV